MSAQKAKSAQAIRRRNRELSILNAIARALNESADLGTALESALEQVAGLFGLRTGWIWLLREGSGESYLAAARNLPPALVENPRRMEGRCYCLDTYRRGDLKGAANVNVVSCSRLHGLVDGTAGLRCHASVPLYARGRKLGVLNVASVDWRELDEGDLRLLHTIGDLLSIAVERARLFERSAELGAAEERNRLAREIHDTLGQGLAGLLVQLETADALLEGGRGQEARETLRHTAELARQNLEEVRRSVMDLRAAPLEGRTLQEALAALAEAGVEGRAVSFEAVGGGRPLPVRLEAGLYRMAQEALANAARHAGQGRIHLYLETAPGRVRLVVEDDGTGFDPSQVGPDRFGLVGLNERARLLGGSLRVQSSPGEGTRVEALIPLEVKK